jgi:hypothetical protein
MTNKKHKISIFWTDELEFLAWGIGVAIILGFSYYFYIIWKNSYTQNNLNWYETTQKVSGKLIKVEPKKVIIQRRREENFMTEYQVSFSYVIDNQAFTNSQTISSNLKNQTWYNKLKQHQVDSIVTVEYSINNTREVNLI